MVKQINLGSTDDPYKVTALEWKDLKKLGIDNDDIRWCKHTGGTHKAEYSRDQNLPPFMKELSDTWYEDWVKQGSKDDGTCTGGNSLRVEVIPKRCKYPNYFNIAKSPPAQGNLGKAASSKRALEKLNKKLKDLFGGQIQGSYYDGWMD
jgi:hypothetical protein